MQVPIEMKSDSSKIWINVTGVIGELSNHGMLTLLPF